MKFNSFQNLFLDFAPESKIWIFFSKEPFSNSQLLKMEQILTDFLPNWQAHGKDLSASHSFLYNHFLLVAADSNQENPSGCSIDNLVHTIQLIEKETNLKLLDRQWVPIVEEDKIFAVSFKEFSTKKKENKNLKFFDSSVSLVSEFREQFFVDLKN